MNTSTTGLRTGLPSQYASAEESGTPRFRTLTATGAAQHVHIIGGIDSAPPATVLTAGPRCRASGNGNTSPQPNRAYGNVLFGVDSAPDGSTWAVGYSFRSGYATPQQTLIERYSC
jgi:hypothetical protein